MKQLRQGEEGKELLRHIETHSYGEELRYLRESNFNQKQS